jgi:hypothetical protein
MWRRASARLSLTVCSSISICIVVFAFAIAWPPCEVWCLVVKGVKATRQECAGGGLDTLEEYRISACLLCLIALCMTGHALEAPIWFNQPRGSAIRVLPPAI